MLRKSWILVMASAAMIAGPALAATFGTVVPIGGEASDLALDEARGVLYIADFTANRVDVMSLASKTITTSINISPQPSSISMSADGHWLVVAGYGNATPPASQQNTLTLIDLTSGNYAMRTYSLGAPPLGVAFGSDGKALVVTTTAFLLFDPSVGTISQLETIAAAAAQALPAPLANSPTQITGASVATSADYSTIYGLADDLEFRYRVGQGLSAGNYTSSPPQGPRAVAVAADGSYAVMGWVLTNQYSFDAAEFPSPTGALNVGGHAVDSARGLVYSEVPTAAGQAPVMTIRSSDNLTLIDTIQIPENFAGKAVLTADGNTMYAISASGVTVLPVGQLNQAPRISAGAEDLLFLGNFCNRNIATQSLTITDPGGNNTPFTITSSAPGVTVSPSSGVTPATVTVQVDPNQFANQKGTVQVSLAISSAAAVNIPQGVRVLINSPDPSQRGTIVNVPGTLVDLMADSRRNQYYVLRQDKNQVAVFNSTNNTQIATLRTCTKPMSMAESIDGSTLLVGCDNAHLMSTFDLSTLQLQAAPPIDTASGYVQSLAVSSKAILAVMRDGSGGPPYIAKVDLGGRMASKLPALGAFQNQVLLNTVLTAAPNGSTILGASADGSVLIYDATVDSFVASRKDFTSLSGAYAASAYGQYVVGNNLLDSSGAPIGAFNASTGNSSGFAFVDQTGYWTTAQSSASPGVMENIQLSTQAAVQPTGLVEAPVLGTTSSAPAAGTSTTSCSTSGTVQTCTTTTISGSVITTETCTTTTSGTNSTQTCATRTGTEPNTNAFTHSLVALQDRSAFLSLSTSGVTVVPWNYAASVAPPQISAVVSAADDKSPAAPGGLVTVWGTQLSPTNQATSQIPVPTALASSCLTVNGQPMPLIFVSPNQINAQMPFEAFGNVTMVVHTPGGVSNNFNLTVQPNAPAVFLSGVAGPVTDIPTIVRADNNLLVTDSDPVHRGDTLVIYLTGMGAVSPVVNDGLPAPSSPLAEALTAPQVTLGGVPLNVDYAGLAPGEVGVYQINVSVPSSVPEGLSVPLVVSQGGPSQSVNVRVVQ